jgi:hypothetical protein
MLCLVVVQTLTSIKHQPHLFQANVSYPLVTYRYRTNELYRYRTNELYRIAIEVFPRPIQLHYRMRMTLAHNTKR